MILKGHSADHVSSDVTCTRFSGVWGYHGNEQTRALVADFLALSCTLEIEIKSLGFKVHLFMRLLNLQATLLPFPRGGQCLCHLGAMSTFTGEGHGRPLKLGGDVTNCQQTSAAQL